VAYGLFDAVTYTTFFILAFLGYEKSTGKNPAANLKALLGVCFLLLGIIGRMFQFGAIHNKCELGLFLSALASSNLDGEVI
jgi:hypothetical protein